MYSLSSMYLVEIYRLQEKAAYVQYTKYAVCTSTRYRDESHRSAVLSDNPNQKTPYKVIYGVPRTAKSGKLSRHKTRMRSGVLCFIQRKVRSEKRKNRSKQNQNGGDINICNPPKKREPDYRGKGPLDFFSNSSLTVSSRPISRASSSSAI